MTEDTMLLRQVHPSWVQQGRVTSQAFRPTPKDKHMLSVYDGDMTTPADSWTHFCGILGFQSIGVMAVTVGECSTLELPARPRAFPRACRDRFLRIGGEPGLGLGWSRLKR